MNIAFLYNRLFSFGIIFYMLAIVAQAQTITTPNAPINTTKSDIKAWQQTIIYHISQHQYYPRKARKNRIQGSVIVKLLLDNKGSLINITILKSSHTPSLDEATVEMLKKASPYPQPPKELLKDNTLMVTLPIVYKLDKQTAPHNNFYSHHEVRDVKTLVIALFFLINIFITQ